MSSSTVYYVLKTGTISEDKDRRYKKTRTDYRIRNRRKDGPYKGLEN